MMAASPQRIFDRALYRRRRGRQLDSDLILAGETAAQMAERIGSINRRFQHALDLSSRDDAFEILRPAAANWVRAGYGAHGPHVIADEEVLPFADGAFDLVTSVLSLHSVNDLPGALIQIRHALRPDGALIAALFGGETLRELRLAFAAAEADALGGASPRIAPFADVRDLGALLQRAGFALPVADVERTTILYRDPLRLFGDLRALGETNVLTQRRPQFLSRKLLQAVVAEYARRFSDDQGRFPATFDIIYLIGWAPHESQPKPLRRGSAKASLADVLSKSRPASDSAD
jgi:SAM-dependent methyltransferase